ncbi:MAG TPA: hypothetical protein VJ874_04605 [Candidatus Thermoplasmatota archaeon]|nr:hypothetical protein [Candidatus Thermoplasmatota archaeon]
MPTWPPLGVVLSGLGVVLALAAIHAVATQGTGHLGDAAKAQLAVTPATTLSHWWRHLWAGLFHNDPLHIGYNLAVFAASFWFATRQMSWAGTLANMYWIGPFAVFTLHLLVVLPLAKLGVPYAVEALHKPLVGSSVMAYSVAGAAFTLAPAWAAVGFAAVLVAYELVLAAFGTGPFIWLYHLGGFALGYWVRTLWLGTANGRIVAG